MRTAIAAAALTLAPSFAQEPPSKPPEPPGWTGVLDEQTFAALHQLRGEKAPEPRGESVQVDNVTHYLSMPTGRGPFPAIIVIHEWWGLNDHIKHWADRLAADGYVALAIDLYDGVVATTREEARAAMRSATEDPTRALATMRASFRFLSSHEQVRGRRTGCLGWCFGGGMSLRLAMAEPELDATIIYYGRLVDDPEQLARIRAPVLGVFGTEDRGIPPESVESFASAMKQAERPCRIRSYEANHAFANPSSARYDEANAAQAWSEVRAFLREHLMPPEPIEKQGGKRDAGTDGSH